MASPGAKWDADAAMGVSQLAVLTRQLDRICQTVHPAKETFQTFGHEIRNLLILTCTEIEAHWSGVLKANGVKKTRLTTVDYAKVERPMRLSEYSVKFPSFPWLAPIKPFSQWRGTTSPTHDLPWYDAYNAVKHDREASFWRATLEHAFEAISACFVMMVAQYGEEMAFGYQSDLRSYLSVDAKPSWSYSEMYSNPNVGPGVWSAVLYAF